MTKLHKKSLSKLSEKVLTSQNGYLYIMNTLRKDKTLGPTKGHKRTRIQIPQFLVDRLKIWKKHQTEALLNLGVSNVTDEQFVFSYTDFRGHINQPLHSDYLNYRLNAIMHRHPELTHAYPHKLRHTYSTLAREGGATMEDISEALTHSDITTTRVYVNAPDFVDLTTNNMFAKRIRQAQENTAKAENHHLI